MIDFPLIIGHRGASAHAPENTLAAFSKAIEAGADGVEFDVRLASDGVPMVVHDATLERVGTDARRVCALTSEQLGQIDVGSWFNRRFPERANAGFYQETVPTLERVLDLFHNRDFAIYVELKCNETDCIPLVEAVCNVIRDSPLLPRMIVKSFQLSVIPELHRRLPQVQTAALFEPTYRTLIRPRRHIVDLARKFGANQLSLHHLLVTRNLAAAAAAAKMPMTVWTVNDVKWPAKNGGLGVAALITNDPAAFVRSKTTDWHRTG